MAVWWAALDGASVVLEIPTDIGWEARGVTPRGYLHIVSMY
jgi:hypothetical protein